MATPLLSICIPTHNRADWLAACLESVLPQAEAMPEGLVEVVVSDNVSEDRTSEMLADYASRYPLLRVNRNTYNNHAVNFDTVLQCAQGSYAWLLGDDDALLAGALKLVVDLIQAEPRDLYLPHVVMDSMDPAVRRLEWFQELPRLDWDLSDPRELQAYMEHGCSASAVFSFISVLIFRRLPWLEASAARPVDFSYHGWPQVATGLEYVKRHGRLRVIPEALVNYHCSTGAWGEAAWDRAMVDLRGLLQVADHFFPDEPQLFDAFMGNLRKNHGDAWIAHHRSSAPDAQSWAQSKALLLRAGFDPLKVAAVDLGADLLAQAVVPSAALDPAALLVGDLGFIARGARRTLVMTRNACEEDFRTLLAGLERRTLAEILVLCPEGPDPDQLPAGERVACFPLDLGRYAAEPPYQEEINETLRSFSPDLVVNADRDRHLGWDLMAAAAGAVGGVAFQAPERVLDLTVALWLDGRYTRLQPRGPLFALASALGLDLAAPDPLPQAPSFLFEGPMKLNLGCGQEHLAGWVNVDKFPEAHPDLVHDLERFPWPFPDGAAEEVLLKHVLEHLGRDSDTFLGIMKELYRICAPGARVRILVPHPRHQDFLQDPTHVRPVLPEMFQHFSLAVNEEWGRLGLPGTPLAKYLGLDFEGVSTTLQLDPRWDEEYSSGRLTREGLDSAMRDHNNVVQSSEVILRAVKPFRGAGRPVPEVLPLRWEGSQFLYHSLAHVNRQLCMGLLKAGGVDLSIVPYEVDQFDGAASAFSALAACVRKPLKAPAAVHVRHQWPPDFNPPAQGAWVMIQPWEFGGIPAEWLQPMRDLVDELWVPSTWVKDCYVKSGIPAGQVVVVPNGVDTDVFKPEGGKYPLATTKGCRFLFLGGTIHRKGIDVLLEAYVKTFRASDDVCLVVKAQGGGVYGRSEFAQGLRLLREQEPQAPEIEYITGDLEEADIAALYRACDVLVLPYRGEGFGLPIAEAMASGLPVIVTGRGAAADFVTEGWAYLVPSTPVIHKTVDDFTPGKAGFWLEEPDAGALGALMRKALEDPGERRAKGLRAREHALAALGWEHPIARIKERLADLATREPRRFSPPAPPEAPEGPEAFLFTPDWSQAEWVEVLLSYLHAFGPGEPVALVFSWSGADRSLEDAQEQILGLVRQTGREAFPDVVLVDKQEELAETLKGYAVVHPVPSGTSRVEGLTGPCGLRFAQARRQMTTGS